MLLVMMCDYHSEFEFGGFVVFVVGGGKDKQKYFFCSFFWSKSSNS